MVKRFVLVALGLGIAASVLVPAIQSTAQGPPAPQCPAGTTFNAVSGACEAPACAAGSTFDPATGFCTVPVPAGGFCVPPAVPVVGAGGVLVCGSPAPACGAGLTGPTPGGLCTSAATFICPPGETLVAGLCQLPAPACGAGHILFDGQCLPVGSAGPAFAQGGNGGDARGGDGGRGGDGFAPQCNQNINDTYWADQPPTVSCGAGGSGGDAGKGGVSDGGDGGLAFTDGFA